MTKRWYKPCPRCRQGRLFIMKYDDSDALLLLCEECEWAYKDPQEATVIERGFFGMDIDCDFADENAISQGGWQEFAMEVAED